MKKQVNIKNKRAALILFGAAFILLVANLIVVDTERSESIPENKQISKNEIDSLFHLSLTNLGLNEQYIQVRKRSKTPFAYTIKIPNDLSIPVLLFEINQVFSEFSVSVDAIEKKLNGMSLLKISSDEIIILEAELQYDHQGTRKGNTLAFIIDDFALSAIEDSLLMEIPEPFSSLLIPHTKNIEVIEFLESRNKTYSLLINDDIPELKYKLNEDYLGTRLEGPLLSILTDFSGASSIFIDDNSNLYKSSARTYIQDELSRRKIALNKLSSLNIIESKNPQQLFDSLIKNIGNQDSIIILIGQEDFRSILDDIKNYKKLGNKIVHASEIL